MSRSRGGLGPLLRFGASKRIGRFRPEADTPSMGHDLGFGCRYSPPRASAPARQARPWPAGGPPRPSPGTPRGRRSGCGGGCRRGGSGSCPPRGGDQVRPRHLQVVCGLLRGQLRVDGGHGDGVPLRDLQKGAAEEIDGGARQQEHAAVAELQAQLEDVPERRRARLASAAIAASRRDGGTGLSGTVVMMEMSLRHDDRRRAALGQTQ